MIKQGFPYNWEAGESIPPITFLRTIDIFLHMEQIDCFDVWWTRVQNQTILQDTLPLEQVNTDLT